MNTLKLLDKDDIFQILEEMVELNSPEDHADFRSVVLFITKNDENNEQFLTFSKSMYGGALRCYSFLVENDITGKRLSQIISDNKGKFSKAFDEIYSSSKKVELPSAQIFQFPIRANG